MAILPTYTFFTAPERKVIQNEDELEELYEEYVACQQYVRVYNVSYYTYWKVVSNDDNEVMIIQEGEDGRLAGIRMMIEEELEWDKIVGDVYSDAVEARDSDDGRDGDADISI